MSYVGGPFKYDLFISYGRANRPGSPKSPYRQWSLAFARELTAHLRGPQRFYKSDRTLEVFLDETEITGLDFLTPLIRRSAESSAMLVILMTEDYLSSGWCRQELEAWDAGQTELQVPADRRIAVVRVEPTKEDLWHKRLRDADGIGLAGYWFHAQPVNATQVVLPYGYPLPAYDTAGEFQQPFRQLGADLHGRLIALRGELEARAEAERVARQSAAPWLYLHGRAGQDADWNTFRQRLSDGGFHVFPTRVDRACQTPAEEQSSHDLRVSTMGQCDALLMMSTDSDEVFDADLTYIARRVRRSLQARGQPLLPCALLNTVAQQTLTANRRALAKEFRLKWIDSTQDQWMPEVQAWLGEVIK